VYGEQFNLLVKPVSDACPHKCQYCFFLNTQEGSKRMSLETLEVLTKNYHESVQAGAFDWQGGEPCLRGVDFFREAVELQRRYPSREPACNSLQTSGTLLDAEWIKLLQGPGEWVVGLSCDGPTNESRGIPNSDIERAARLLRDGGVPFSLLCVVSRENVHKPKEVVRYLATLGPHFQAIPCHRRTPGGEDPGPSPSEWWAWLSGAHAAIRDEGLPISFGNAMTVGGMKRGMAGDCTHTGCGTYLVVSPSGSVHPCDFFVEDPYCLGSIHEHSLADIMRSKRMADFKALHDIPHADCEPCKVRSLCNRGCPRDRFLVAGDFTTKNPLCEGVQFLARIT
jgi:uncharacterized protein